MNSKIQEYLNKKKELENNLIVINEHINLLSLYYDLEELGKLIEQLNLLYQNHLVIKYSHNSHINNPSNLIYDAMKMLDKSYLQLKEEIEAIEDELNID